MVSGNRALSQDSTVLSHDGTVLDFSRLVSPIPRMRRSRSRKHDAESTIVQTSTPSADSPPAASSPSAASSAPPLSAWSLIDDLAQNRTAYAAPKEGGVSLKLTIPFHEQVRRLCQRAGKGHNGKDPGIQPVCYAMIEYALPVIEEWPEMKELTESVSRRLALPDSSDKEISRQIYRYAEELKLPSVPKETARERNVILGEELGQRLLTCAGRAELPYHPLASLCVLVALAAQPVGVNIEEREEIARLVKETRRRLHTAGWCAGALMDKLETREKAARE